MNYSSCYRSPAVSKINRAEVDMGSFIAADSECDRSIDQPSLNVHLQRPNSYIERLSKDFST
jgi:hypothetical protein